MTRSVLRRKLAPRPAPPPPAADHGAAPRALVQGWARVMGHVAGLLVEGVRGQSRNATLAEVLDHADPEGFVALLDLADGATGLVVLDPTALTTVIEAMTTGRLMRHTPAPRPATPTDAALVAELVETLFADLPAGAPGGALAGARLGRMVSDPRLLEPLLDCESWQITRIDATLIHQAVSRPAQVLLIAPLAPPPDPPQGAPSGQAADGRAGDAIGEQAWACALEQAVAQAPADLHAVLARLTRPLGEVMALGPDSRILLPLALLEEVRVEALDRELVATARLGQSRGMRAVRLTRLPNDPFAPDRPDPGTAEADTPGSEQIALPP